MNPKLVIGGVFVAIVLVAAVGAYTGAGPAPSGDSGDSDVGEFPTEEPADDGGSGTTGSTDTAPFTFTVDETTECGTACRDVTATLNNAQNGTATGVTTYIRIYAGESNTDADDVVWEGTVEVGTLESGASYTTTERVKLSLRDGLKVDRNDGWITIQTTVESDDATVTFRRTRRV